MAVVLRAGDALQVVVVGATVSLDYVTDQIDKDNSNPPIISTAGADGNIAAATAGTTISSAVSANHEATIKWVSLTNVHASASFTVQLAYLKSGGTLRKIGGAYSLAPGECIVWNGDGTVFAYDAVPGVKPSLAVALKRTVITASTTYNTPNGCRAIDVEAWGGAGGSGGAALGSSTASVSGGGGSGGYGRKMLSPPPASLAIVIGAAGTAGATTPTAGGAGGDTTVGGTTLIAKGGSGSAAGIAAGSTVAAAAGGAGGVVGSGGDINFAGEPGLPGVRLSGAAGQSGAGGNSTLGGGGAAVIAAGVGGAPTANSGSGAGGSLSTAAAQAGQAGAAGIVIITEYY